MPPPNPFPSEEISTAGNGERDFAFLRVPGLGFCVGRGPITEHAQPPPDGAPCFHANDFLLADPRPWKQPARFEISPDLSPLARTLDPSVPEIGWDPPGWHQWESLFRSIGRDLESGRYLKIVPVVTEIGRLLGGSLDSLVPGLPGLPEVFWSYGYRVGDRGLVGATPERLFSLENGTLQTMALAGTAPIEREQPFVGNAKEIREHELVADHLEATLTGLGRVRRGPRETLRLGSIVHFKTDLEVELAAAPASVEDLVALLHPTPALGVLPRTPDTLARLADLRERAGTPRRFGAPFGVAVGGVFHGVVGIRHVCWRGETVMLPSGCGLIAESDIAREWRELALKREAVRRLFGL